MGCLQYHFKIYTIRKKAVKNANSWKPLYFKLSLIQFNIMKISEMKSSSAFVRQGHCSLLNFSLFKFIVKSDRSIM